MTETPDRSRPPAPGARPRVELPELREFRVGDADIGLWVAEDRQLPEVSVRLLVEAGAVREPDDRTGVAALTSRLLTEGNDRRSATEMAEWGDRLGIGFRATASHDLAFLGVGSLTETLDGALDFLAAAVREPTFPPDEAERVREELVDELERDRDEPDVVADQALARSVFGDHRYAIPSSGTPESVRGLGREDVEAFYRSRYTADDAGFVVCGDVDPEAVRDAVEERFGDWRPGEGRVDPGPPPDRARDAGRVVVVDRPGSRQAEIRLGGVGVAYGADDFYAARVANAVLGGLFNSRVNMNLREEKGWTYGAGTTFRPRRAPGPFVGRTAVQTDAAAAALEEFLGEVRGLWEDPPGEEEMELARNSLVESLPRQFETVHQVTRKVAAQVAYGLPDDYWERYPERIRAVTAREAAEAARRRMRPSGLAAVVVADADEVAGGLERRFDRVEIRDFP